MFCAQSPRLHSAGPVKLSRVPQDVRKHWRRLGWPAGMLPPQNAKISLTIFHMTGQVCSLPRSLPPPPLLPILEANASANHNRHDLLHKIRSEDHWKSSRALYVDWWEPCGDRVIQVSVRSVQGHSLPPPTNGHLTISSFILYVNKLNSQKKTPKKLFHVLKKAIFMQASKSNFSSDYDLHCACGSHLNSTWQLSFSNSPLSDRIRPECNLLCSHLWSYYILFFWMHCCLWNNITLFFPFFFFKSLRGNSQAQRDVRVVKHGGCKSLLVQGPLGKNGPGHENLGVVPQNNNNKLCVFLFVSNANVGIQVWLEKVERTQLLLLRNVEKWAIWVPPLLSACVPLDFEVITCSWNRKEYCTERWNQPTGVIFTRVFRDDPSFVEQSCVVTTNNGSLMITLEKTVTNHRTNQTVTGLPQRHLPRWAD